MRLCIGVVPAWFCCPLKVMRMSLIPTISVTMPTVCFASYNQGPCSIWHSIKPVKRFGLTNSRGFLAIFFLSLENWKPSLSIKLSASFSDRISAHIALPVVTPKRPSSSWKLTTEIAGPLFSRDSRANSKPQITPSAPSNHPPWGWVSECDPIKIELSCASPKRLPTGS